MKRKWTAILLTLLLFSLTGCRLARDPSQQQSENSALSGARFVGVYVVREDRFAPPDRTHWTEYGSTSANTEFGTLTTGKEILIGSYDESTHQVTFPGLEGHALFAMYAESYHTVISDMVGGSFHVTSTDAGSSYDLSGTLYFTPPDHPGSDEDYVWRHYHVYQMEDGTVFLNGYGDSHNGPMGSTVTISNATTVNGAEQEKLYTRVEVQVDYISRLTALTVLQYDGQGNLLGRTQLPVEGRLPTLTWQPDARWAVVEELRDEELTHTVLERAAHSEMPDSHTVILSDPSGFCSAATLQLEESSPA